MWERMYGMYEAQRDVCLWLLCALVVCMVYVEYIFSFQKIYSYMYGIFATCVSL